ncbi:TPR and ankyrin repeat-containing protein 1-like isoform X2 [Stylophora pistillata]|nr:TPR and ankyrin repeat-containing protein 1-like isoform X2 [Stylophora pistillata]
MGVNEAFCSQIIIQRAVDDAVSKQNWERLRVLFVGGGGPYDAPVGKGGLASGCDSSQVPLDLVIASSVAYKSNLLTVLLEFGACVDGLPLCKKPPLLIALEIEEFDIASKLISEGAHLACVSNQPQLQSKAQAKFWKGEANKVVKCGETEKVSQYYKLALEYTPKQAIELKRECLDALADICFEGNKFTECIEYGEKGYEVKPMKNKESVQKWRERGNKLFKERKYELVVQYYSLAMEYIPETMENMQKMSAVLLSNRCAAYLNLQCYDKAKEDAERCVQIDPQWSKGYYRLGSCLNYLGQNLEALRSFCDGLKKAETDDDKFSLASHIISNAVNVKDGTLAITCRIPRATAQRLIKDVCAKKEWNKLQLLFLGGDSQRSFAKGRGGVATGCNAGIVPISQVLESSVHDRDKLIAVLLDHGALANGLHGSKHPPLSVALEMEHYGIAYTLLKHGADPSGICCSRVTGSHHRENQGHFWKDEGVKALSAKDYIQAIKLLNLALQFPNNSADLSYIVNNSLATAYFETKQYVKAVEKGRECFKVKPTKSQTEASKWKERGKRLFSEKEFSILVEYYTLSMQYVPSNDKEFLATLLCNRALAHYNICNYQQGLTDAKSCTRFRPEWYKGFVRQGFCHACLDQNRDAVRALGEGLKRAENDGDKFVILSQIVDLGLNLSDGTSSITCSVPNPTLEKLIKQLSEKKAWDKLHVLYLGGGGPQRYSPGEGGLATGIDASEIPIELVFGAAEKYRAPLIVALLENGASSNGLGKAIKCPLELAIDNEEYNMVVTLLQYNADPACIMSKAGDSLLHQALRQAFATGSTGLIQALLDSELFDPDTVDSSGNTLSHLVAFGNCSRRKCAMISVLTDAGANPMVKNTEGKVPLDYLTKKDPRAKLIRQAINSYKSGKKSGGGKRKRKVIKLPGKTVPGHETTAETAAGEGGVQEEAGDEWCNAADKDVPESNHRVVKVKAEDKKPMPVAVLVKKDPLDDLRTSIKSMIECISVVNNSEMETTEDDLRLQQHDKEEQCDSHHVPDIERIINDDDDDDEEVTEGEFEVDLESPFEDLPWEVDCTDQFWKALQNTNVSDSLKRRIIGRIRMLAEGRWTKTLCRRLDGIPKKRNIMLFEAKLTRASRIIWELTVAFSAKCSNDPELRMQMETSAGRIYSEIIRVWDIAADRDGLMAKVESIVKSHDRGLSCIVKKKLSGFRKGSDKVKNVSGERLPNFFVELSEKVEDFSQAKTTKIEKSSDKYKGSQFFFPPASPNDMEFHILKFYSFSSLLINSVLHSNPAAKVDFPFRVTELEHAIINLRPSQPCPIILLGRSGTGKTTCCLYRLWNEFQFYWEKAATAGPHIPKVTQYLPKADSCRSITACELPEELPLQSSSFRVLEDIDEHSPSDEFIRAKDARRKDYEEGDDTVEPSEFEEVTDAQYEHLHQVFITKNPVLCNEVQKNFSELRHAFHAVREHAEKEATALSFRIQDIDDAAWPLFINSRDWLLLLDASLPGCEFFPRDEDGSLLRKIYGWGEEECHLVAIEDDSDSEVEEQDDTHANDIDDVVCNRSDPKSFDPRREVTYVVFVSELWPRMMKKVKAQYHPTLVWTEIRSFIKGSVEALHTEHGFLTLEEYSDLGRKRAPNFSADRDVVYSLFVVYQNTKRSLRMFDEADVVHNIYTRLQKVQVPDWSVHRFYVDETQDFTQAELCLLIRCSRDPNGLFFTGDTAQSIMRGIAFRFNDLKSLFFYSQQSYQALGFQSGVRVPNRLYQLTHNYRSHAGILRLASSVVDLILHYFPESFDRLEKDQGLFEGPKPVLLESCSFGDLAMILRGNRRQSSRIEFGAHQVILVASEEARNQMPDELKQALILTIYESKGLEFDDVLIYNFFKDSQAKKEWRVVTSYIKELSEGRIPDTSGLIELAEEDLEITSRPLDFDSDRHKVLNSEFKFLYTAITRARVNVWFFDEEEEARAPVFEYFQKRGLVRVIRMSGEANETDQLTSMFVEKSTEAEWCQQGHYFYNKELWEVAVKCFTMASDQVMVKKSQAQLQAAEASKIKGNPKLMRAQFLKAANQFLQCAMLDEGAKCLHNACERLLLARLNKKLGKFEDAAKLLRKERHYLEASECYEMINDYHQAVEILCQGNLYKEAIDTLQRYKSLVGTDASKGGIRSPRESRTVERLCHQLAEEHFSSGRLDEMVSVLEGLPSANDRILFLENHGCVQEAMEALVDEGRYADAGNLLSKNGRFIEAVKFVHTRSFAAECFLSAARCAQNHASVNERRDLVEGSTEKALELFKDCNDENGQAQCLLILARLNKDVEDAESARKLFNKVNNICGEVEACLELFTILNEDVSHVDLPGVFVTSLNRLFGLIMALNKPQRSVVELQKVEMCETYFGVFKGDKSDLRYAFVNSGALFVTSVPYSQDEVKVDKVVLDEGTARWRIACYMCGLAFELVQNISQTVEFSVRLQGICRKSLVGLTCNPEHCQLHHAEFSQAHFEKLFSALCTQIHVNALVQLFADTIGRFDPQRKLSQKLLTREVQDFQACRQLYDLLFPKMGLHISFLGKEHVRFLRRNSAIRERLSRCAEFLWKITKESQRWVNPNKFIKISRILNLVGQPGKIGALLSVEEKGFAMRNMPCDGMLKDKYHGGFRSFFRLFHEGNSILHVYGDVLNAAHSFIRRFFSMIAWRSSIPFPSAANTSAVFEHQLVSCLALFACLFKDYENPVCLPESYLHLIGFWDAVHGSDKFPSLFSIVEATAARIPSFKGIRGIQRLLEYTVQLMSGQVHCRFNLITSAFSVSSFKRVLSGESERIMILAMTMLCNYGSGIPAAPCGRLIESLRSVTVHPFLPVRMQRALEAVQNANGVQDIVTATQTLLSQRNEALFSVRWCNGGFLTAEVNVAFFKNSFSADSAPWHSQTSNSSEPPVDVYSPSEFQMPTGYLEEQRKERALETEREEAAIKIQRWFRRIKWETPETTPCDKVEEQPADSVLLHFERFKVDTSACSICRVHFSDKPDGVKYESHIVTESQHWRQLRLFNQYKQLFLGRIWPLFEAEKELREQLNALSGQNRVGSHDFGLDVQRLDHAGARVGECVREIESHCMWGNTDRLMHEVEALGATVNEVQEIVRQDQQKLRGGDATVERRDYPEENDDFADEEDILDLCGPKDGAAKGGGGGKRGGKKRNRGKRGRDKTRFRQS